MGDIKLRKSSTDKYISGVCGGIGESFGIDPTIIRLAWAVLTLMTGVIAGVILYGLAAAIMPEDDEVY